ncbi:phospholipid-transporting ATPase 1 [Nannizzia gypsea CBS 118893]|uniref:Phospholipid-transporting ATPase n=1 Tax=Arthroderma gypseum (strain ATCC MYA-4604 / CBS 118893) TaxID=535722 RepID=E4UYR5_ARTGP|nr:phospholipid-transporting ATPase 1 [Nannizzia gypsea CBS 118893]EFR03245.1 phospholipid-transporting ATPase 1 [Nannizzia gypsea CBS 118893]
MAGESNNSLGSRTSSSSSLRQTPRSPLRQSTMDEEPVSADEGNETTVEYESIARHHIGGQQQQQQQQKQGEEGSQHTPDIDQRRHSIHRVRFSTDIDRAEQTASTLRAAKPDSDDTSSTTTITATPTSTTPASLKVPPAGRNRGYSLRRALFNRNLVPTQPEEPDLEQNGASTSGQSEKTIGSDMSQEATTEKGDYPTLARQSEFLKSTTAFLTTRPVKKISLTHTINSWLVFLLSLFKTHVLRIKDIPPSADGRHVDLDAHNTKPRTDERTGKHYISNTIRSSRYSLWSFLPRQLIAQFSKLANFYFLCVAILQMIPGLSTTGTFTTFVPLIIFVGISIGKEGYDDFRRYRLDKEENNRIASVLRPSPEAQDECYESLPKAAGDVSSKATDNPQPWVDVKWVNIQVGDIIKLERDQAVPADIVLLHADDPNGIAYIETMALDGETNLKSKKPCPLVAKAFSTVDDIINNRSTHFVLEDPNIDLYKFEGNVTVGDETAPLTNTEVVYRGSILRNTHEAIGMVIYTGEECKIRMNATKNPRIKAPALQTMVNRVVAVIVIFVVALAGACTIAYKYWSRSTERMSWYLKQANVSYGPIFTSFLIMLNTMIPISLYVSLEIVKVAQMFLLNDVDMYDEASNTPLEARTSTINEELGQISYVFSDKTGTLTDNSMRFRKMSVAGTAWLHDPDLVQEAADEMAKKILLRRHSKGKKSVRAKSFGDAGQGRPSGLSRRSGVSQATTRESGTWRPSKKSRFYHGGKTTEMLQYVMHKPHTLFAKRVRFFIVAMALCHTCLPERGQDGEYTFQAASPDEVALVTAAKELGYLVSDRQPNSITIRRSEGNNSNNDDNDDDIIEETYEVLDIIEFTSSRKRMSVVVRLPDGRICVFTKGADSTITQLLKQASLAGEKVQEIERRASKRKAMESMEIIRRNSEHMSRGGRKSLSIHRPSFAGRRSSVSGKQGPSIRQSIDMWLRDRETDGGLDIKDGEHEAYNYSPRASVQLGGGRGSPRVSFQTDDGAAVEEDLVDESLVTNEPLVFERCFQHLNDFATEGLRTLLYAYRFVGESEYNEWKQVYKEATVSLVNRQEKIDEAGEQIETQLELIGATAIEDKLQKGVPETIDKLRRANIKLWMLTGDKRETAINIGHSCRLVKDYSAVIILDHETGTVKQTITSTIESLSTGGVAHSVIVVDGQTLSVIEGEEELRELFFDVAIRADSVICCRASPKQKAFLVRSIRKRVNGAITLAIGDGANDIAMIQEAHVGIGITGKEGLQAARISDYSIAQFRFLLKLLLVHGRWNYVRVCKYTLGTFWKETLFYLTQALFQRWNGYTGTSLYEPWSLSMFNTLFTSLPVIFLGTFEKDLAASTLLAVPELYTKGQRNEGFNIPVYLGWATVAACESMMVYFTMMRLFGDAIFTADSGIFAMGLLTYSACVIVINLKLQFLEIHDHTVLTLIPLVLSIGGWWLWNIILSEQYKYNEIYNVRNNFIHVTGKNALWWTTLIVVVVVVVLFEITVATVRKTLWPTDVDLFQGYEKDGEVKRRFEEAAASELAQGWEGRLSGEKGGNDDHDDDGYGANAAGHEQEHEHEMHVQELIERRTQEEDHHHHHHHHHHQHEGTGVMARARRSLDMHELFSKGFGSIRRGQDIK